MPVRLIATDLDGTFFGDDHLPTARNAAAANAAREAGIRVVAVSGRSHRTGADLVTASGARFEWFIGSNGGHRLNLGTGTMEERLLFEPGEVTRLREELSAALGPVGFGWEVVDEVIFDGRFVELSPISISGHPRTVGAPPHPTDGIGKIFVGHPDVVSTELVELVSPYVDPEINVTTSGAPFIEITPPGADKGSGLARLCASLEIDAQDVVAFGDNQNDLTMLAWAGRGVAMANALDVVKAVADEVTDRNHDHGVAMVIEALLSGS